MQKEFIIEIEKRFTKNDKAETRTLFVVLNYHEVYR